MAKKRNGEPTGWTVIVAIAYCSLEIQDQGEWRVYACLSVCACVLVCKCCSCDIYARWHVTGCSRKLVLGPGDILVFGGHFNHRGSPYPIPGANDNRFLRLHMSVHFAGEAEEDDVGNIHFPGVCGNQKDDDPCDCPNAGADIDAVKALPREPNELDLQVRCECAAAAL
jgi:hypothetical protein